MTTCYPWGTTGRVTLGPERRQGADISRRVEVDGRQVGTVYNPRAVEWTAFAAYGALALRKDAYAEGLPTLDAAVRWVLRRAAADVWRQERGPVWRVESDLLWSPDELVPGWFATRPDRTAGIGWPNWADALACAHNNARAATTS